MKSVGNIYFIWPINSHISIFTQTSLLINEQPEDKNKIGSDIYFDSDGDSTFISEKQEVCPPSFFRYVNRKLCETKYKI